MLDNDMLVSKVLNLKIELATPHYQASITVSCSFHVDPADKNQR